jgi:ADP-ribosyl-[dinitrogen reductase] hydrolase
MGRTQERLDRAQGCLLGQLAGDSLGSLVEFEGPEEIAEAYPDGVRALADGGTWDTIAGQPTDDSEMALLLARMLIGKGTYDQGAAAEAYRFWLDSEPFDCGMTIRAGLLGEPRIESQANGAMMRVSPLGIFGAGQDMQEVAEWARKDASITHPNPVCLQANALFTMGVATAVESGIGSKELYTGISDWAQAMEVDPTLAQAIEESASSPPADYHLRKSGWVLVAFANALWQLLHAESLEDGVIDTVMRGGDTDTNAAICGALLGAVHGRKGIPAQWEEAVLNCRPDLGNPSVPNPRPECFWPTDALELAEQLLQAR